MRIDPSLATLPLAAVTPRTGSRPNGPRFELRAGGEPARGAAARGAVPLATLGALLALQEEDDPAEKRRRGARRGRDLLDILDTLKAALLDGRVPEATLARLASGLANAAGTGDPGLDDIIAHIELRARVELAKLGRTA